MSFFSPQRSPSKDDYPPPEKPVEGGGREDPPHKQNSHRQNQQQQPNNNPDRHHTHHVQNQQQQQQDNNPDKHRMQHVQNQQQQASASEVVPQKHVSKNNNPERQKDNQSTLNSLELHSSSNHESKDNSLKVPSGKINNTIFPGNQSPEKHPWQQKSPVATVINPEEHHRKTSNNLPKHLKDPPHRKTSKASANIQPEQDHQNNNEERKPQPVTAKTSTKVDQQKSSNSSQKHNNGDLMSREPLPVPDGYPPPRPPTSPSKLEPRHKKGCLEKICPCCF